MATIPFLMPEYSIATFRSRVVDKNAVSVNPWLVMNGLTSSPPDSTEEKKMIIKTFPIGDQICLKMK